MVVFNVNPQGGGLESGLYVWTGEEWVSLSPKLTEAKFNPVACENITLHGTYQQGVPMNENNYLTVTFLNVERVGTYTITASSGNGYNYYLSGVVLDLGRTTLNIPAQGTPRLPGFDQLTINGFTVNGNCIAPVEVLPGAFEFVATATSHGTYQRKTALTNQEYVTISIECTIDRTGVTITPPATAIGGVLFSPQTVNLLANHETTIQFPINVGSKVTAVEDIEIPFEISVPAVNPTDPDITQTAVAHLHVILPDMTYAVVGASNIWTWNNDSRASVLSSPLNFGSNGTLSINHFKLKSNWTITNADVLRDKLSAELNKLTVDGIPINPAIKADLPDVILYSSYSVSGDQNGAAAQLARYVVAGGTLLFGSDDNNTSAVSILLDGIFGLASSNVIAQNGTNSDGYQIRSDLPTDPIINGPFKTLLGEKLGGKYWFEDNSGSIIVKNLPSGSISICSAIPHDGSSTNIPNRSDYSIVWYNPSYHFFYMGDSDAMADTAGERNNHSSYPAKFNSNWQPFNDPAYGGSNPKVDNCTSLLELNAITWAIRQAATDGINFKPE
jgi:hypothetical protein